LTGKLENRNEPLSLKALQSKLQWDRDEVIKCVSQLQSRGTVRDTGDGFVLMD
jgi:biotin operon repressor